MYNVCSVLCLSVLIFALSKRVGVFTDCVCAPKFPCMESRVYTQWSCPAVQPTCGHGIYTGNRTLRHNKPASAEAFFTKLTIFNILPLTYTVWIIEPIVYFRDLQTGDHVPVLKSECVSHQVVFTERGKLTVCSSLGYLMPDSEVKDARTHFCTLIKQSSVFHNSW